MKRNGKIMTAALLSASIGLGAQPLLAQTTPGGTTGPTNPTTPVLPGPGSSMPRQAEPTIPGQPAPGIPQPGPIPGQPGTIPERTEPPITGNQNMIVTSNDVKKAQDALRANGLNPGTDGRMDAKTQQALRDFQKSNNLPATGVLDDKTAAKLGINKNSDMKSMPERRGSSSGPNSVVPNSDSIYPKSGGSVH